MRAICRHFWCFDRFSCWQARVFLRFVLCWNRKATPATPTEAEVKLTSLTFFLMVLKIYLDKCRILIVYPSFVTFKSNVWAMYDALHQDVASQASMYNTWFHGHWIMPCTHIYIHVTTSSIHLSLTDSNRVWANATPLEMYFFFLADLCQAALGWALVWVWPIKRK